MISTNALSPLLVECLGAKLDQDRVSCRRDGRIAWRSIPKELNGALRQAGLRFEAMATGSALRVYNVMQSENRRRGGAHRGAVSARRPPGADALADANRHCAALAHTFARDQWLAALYVSGKARDALLALASFDIEIREAVVRARDPNLAALRLSWWRGIIVGERRGEAAGSPVALALRAATDAYALPTAWLEAMLDARLQEIAPQDDFNLATLRFRRRERARGCGWRRESRRAETISTKRTARAAAAGMTLALTRMLGQLPFKAGAATTLFPADADRRSPWGERRISTRGTRAPASSRPARNCGRWHAKSLSRRSAGWKASPPAILLAFVPLGALRLDLDRLDSNAQRPFDHSAKSRRLGGNGRSGGGRERGKGSAPASRPV